VSFSVVDYAWPAYMGRKPFIHQKHTVKFLIANIRAFVLNDMGTGKTLSAIWASDILLCAKKIRRILIITPLSTMKSVWYNELFLNVPHRRAGIAHGNAAIRERVLKDPGLEFVIINHDGIKSSEDEIVRQQFDVIIIDELTAYKSIGSERTKCMMRIANSAKAVWGMTGDMTPNSPLEAYSQIRVVNPQSRYLPKYFGQFRDACMTQINEMIWIPKPEAPNIVAMCAQPSIRFTRDQCLDLPDTMYQTIETELSKEQTDYYEKMRKEAYIENDSGTVTAVNAAVLLNKLLQISAGAVKNSEGDVIEIGCKARMDQLFEIFDETPQKKLVVFATYRATIEMLNRECLKRGVKSACIHGDVAQNLRDRAITAFQSGDLQLLILQPQSAAHGITLTAASTVVWFSLVPSNEYFQQGNARIMRAGQTRKTQIIMFVSTKAERHIAGILERKDDLSKATLKLFADHDL
jgi:SNF2 family DNA or RNA helicase